MFIQLEHRLNPIYKFRGTVLSSQSPQQIIQVAPNVVVPVSQIFQFLGSCSGISAYLTINFIQVVMLDAVIAIFYPKYLLDILFKRFFNLSNNIIFTKSEFLQQISRRA